VARPATDHEGGDPPQRDRLARRPARAGAPSAPPAVLGQQPSGERRGQTHLDDVDERRLTRLVLRSRSPPAPRSRRRDRSRPRAGWRPPPSGAPRRRGRRARPTTGSGAEDDQGHQARAGPRGPPRHSISGRRTPRIVDRHDRLVPGIGRDVGRPLPQVRLEPRRPPVRTGDRRSSAEGAPQQPEGDADASASARWPSCSSTSSRHAGLGAAAGGAFGRLVGRSGRWDADIVGVGIDEDGGAAALLARPGS
jgi:hypothetical protein